MPVNTREILNVISQLTEDKNVRVCIRESVKGGCIAACTTILGGLLLGPPGLAIGGAVGGCTAAVMSKNAFKPIPQVIMQDMTNAQRERLAASVDRVLQELRIEDMTMLLPLLMSNPMAKEEVLKTVFSFLESEMRMQIID